MRISVVIPCYKQAQYLAEAIESALQADEVIVVNDGSPDNTKEVAEKYPVKLINQVNKGLPSARNTGIMAMTGGYFLPLDADDKLAPGAIDKIKAKIEETGADIIGLSLQEFGMSNGQVSLHPSPTFEMFKEGNFLPYCSAIKKEALIECGGYSPRMIWGWEDLHIWHDLLSRGKKVVTIPEPLLWYRTKEQSMIHDANKHGDELRAQIVKDFPQLYA